MTVKFPAEATACKLLINGAWVDAADGATLKRVSPAPGQS